MLYTTAVRVAKPVSMYWCTLFVYLWLYLPLWTQMLAETMAAVGFEQSVKSVVPLIGPLAEVRN